MGCGSESKPGTNKTPGWPLQVEDEETVISKFWFMKQILRTQIQQNLPKYLIMLLDMHAKEMPPYQLRGCMSRALQ